MSTPRPNASASSGSGGDEGGTPLSSSLRQRKNKSNHTTSMEDDEDSVLSLSEQTNRPKDVALQQQRVNAWHPILDPTWVIVALLYIGVIMVPVGWKMWTLSNSVTEYSIKYDDYQPPPMGQELACPINNTFNAGRKCNLTITVNEYMKPPVLVYYQLTNFYQNYRKYAKSFDPYQLYGRVGSQDAVSRQNCEPLNILGNMTLNPCGLIANTFFNDIFRLVEGRAATGKRLQMREDGIAWQSDLEYMYNQPDGFNFSECPSNGCDASCCAVGSSCTTPWKDPETGKCYRYYYPDDDTTQYLYETYPDIISPIEGVTNEHFVVWMRVAPLRNFRKLYGWFDQPIDAGTKLVFEVTANYAVTPFKGGKALLITSNNIFGGKNIYTALFMLVLGAFCLVSAFFFLFEHFAWKPRKLADVANLRYKEE